MNNKTENSIISTKDHTDDIPDAAIRPRNLSEFIGQRSLKNNLDVFITAAKLRKESLDHVLFHGPPGLGKTTLSQIIAKELGVNIKVTSGPMISKTGELAAILTNLQENDVLFIDEIHRLNPAIEELLYPAMEDYAIDLIIGDGPAARTCKITLSRFTLVGATTRMGMLSNPLRDRFGISLKLEFYCIDELASVIERGSRLMKIEIDPDATIALAKASRGTPRIAVRLLRRVRDFIHYNNKVYIDLAAANIALTALGVDHLGLDILDYSYINYIAKNYKNGPVGIETIAAGLSEDKDTIEDVIEPYLMQIGFIARTTRGRVLTENCLAHINNI
jgi:Holliday junction DNA helicase RuvB